MFPRITIILILNLVLSLGLLAQEKSVELSIQFLSNDKIGDVNFDVDEFAAHGKKTVDLLVSTVVSIRGTQEGPREEKQASSRRARTKSRSTVGRRT